MRNNKRRIASLLALLIVLLSQAPVAAQGEDVALTVTPLLGGNVKYGEWLPLRVTLTNSGGDLEAEVRAEVAGSNGLAIYSIPVPLPAGARKEVILYVQPPNFAQQLTVWVTESNEARDGASLAEAQVPISPYPQSHYFIGALTMNPDALAPLAGLRLAAGSGGTASRTDVRVIPLTLDALPARVEGLRSLDCLVLAGVDTNALTPAQAEALHSWVALGGRLLIGGGAGAARVLAGLPETLCPMALGDTVELDALPSLAAFVDQPIAASGPFLTTWPDPADPAASDVKPVIVQDDRPLLVQQSLGKGWVAYLALDPTAAPFNAWAGTLAFWARLLEPGSALPPGMPTDISYRALEAENMQNPLNNLPSLKLPSLGWITLLLGVYILLVGPLNYLALRAWRRLALAWLTIPMLTLTFSVGGIMLGYRLRGSDVVINQISIVPLTSDGTAAPARSYVGLFSPTRAGYNITIERDAENPAGAADPVGPLVSLMPTAPWLSRQPVYSGQQSLHIAQGSSTRVRDIDVNQWALRAFQVENVVEAEAVTLAITMTLDHERARGTLYNGLDQPLTDVMVVGGSRYARLGDWAAGERRAFEVVWERMGDSFPMAAFNPNFNSPEAPPRGRMVQMEVMDIYLQRGQMTLDDLTLFAWSTWSPVQVRAENTRESHEQITLFVKPVPLTFPEGQVKLPVGALPASLVEVDGQAGPCGRGNTQFYLGRGHIVLDYHLPQGLQHVHPTTMTFQVYPVGMGFDVVPPPDNAIPADIPRVQVYDWHDELWVALNQGQPAFAYTFPTPERFLDPVNLTVRVRAEHDNDGGTCSNFNLGLSGTLRP
jgi:hypothetical protein